jgi:hypothetical protein
MKIKQFSCHCFFPMIHGVVVATIFSHNARPFFFSRLCCLSPLQRTDRHWATSSGGREGKKKRELTLRLWLCALSMYKVAVFRLPEENVGAIVACSDEGAKSSGALRHQERKSFPYPRWQLSGWSGLRWFLPWPIYTRRPLYHSFKAPFDQYVLKAKG